MKAFGLWTSFQTSARSLKGNFALATTSLVAVKDFQVYLLPNQEANPYFVSLQEIIFFCFLAFSLTLVLEQL